jgi:acetolactate synthase-1/2/3 large subunit
MAECQPDFLKLAEAYGIKGMQIDNPKNLEKQLQEVLAYKGAVLVNILVARAENVLPMVPAGGTLNKMLLPKTGALK